MAAAGRWLSSSLMQRPSMGAPSGALRRARGACRCLASGTEPPNIAKLCRDARLALTPQQMEEYSPKIGRIVEWFAQLQDVNLDGVSPAIRIGGIDGGNTRRPDIPQTFDNRDAMLAAVPELEGAYLKVPKILKENME